MKNSHFNRTQDTTVVINRDIEITEIFIHHLYYQPNLKESRNNGIDFNGTGCHILDVRVANGQTSKNSIKYRDVKVCWILLLFFSEYFQNLFFQVW